MPPSSAKHSAPKNVSAPPTSHTAMISSGERNCSAIVAGTMKIPEPITLPTTMPITSVSPRTRASSGCLSLIPPSYFIPRRCQARLWCINAS